MRDHGVKNLKGSVLTISASNPHPSVKAHGLIAETILDYMSRSRLLDRLCEKAAGGVTRASSP